MRFTDSFYCSISRFLLTCIGNWPYQKSSERIIRISFVTLFIGFPFTTQVVKLCGSLDDLDTIIPTVSTMMSTCICYIKLFTFLISKETLKRLQDEINENWSNTLVQEEKEILMTYAAEAKLFTKAYTLYMYVGGIPFFLLIFEPCVLDYFNPLNESRPLKTVYPADYYFIKEEDYFILITIHMIVTAFMVLTVVVAADTMVMIYTQYTCSLFAVTGHRLECTLYTIMDMTKLSAVSQKEAYGRYIMESIKVHLLALKFVLVIENAFSISYLFQIGLMIITVSITLVQVVILMGKLEVVRYIMYVIGQYFMLFSMALQGQRLIDHSVETSNKIYSGVWYNTPIEIQKLLLFMLQRTAVPSSLSAGKMLIFSMPSFSMIVQSCMSYCMVLASFR